MTRRISFAILLAFLLAGLTGCRGPVSWQRLTLNQPISNHDVAFIINGQTRLVDAVIELGPPHEILAANRSVIARYHFSDGKYFRADYGWGLRFIIPFAAPDLVLGGGGFGTDIFQLVCDEHLIVQEHAFAWHTSSSQFRFWPFGEPTQ